MFPRSTMKPLRLLAFHMFCLAVILTFLANITRAKDVQKTTKAQTKASQSARFIQFANGLLTAKVQDVSLKELLQEIARQSGLSVVVSGSFDDMITIQFDQLPFDEAISLILCHHNFILSYDPQKPEERHSTVPQLRKLMIFSKEEKDYPIKTTVIDGNTRGNYIKDVATDIQRLQAALLSEDSWEREEAAEALGESGRPEAVGPLSLALEDADEDVREAAIAALVKIGGDEAAQAFAVALKDEDSWVREEAVEALGEIGGETAIGLLEQALLDEDELVRKAAAEILEKLRDKIRRKDKGDSP